MSTASELIAPADIADYQGGVLDRAIRIKRYAWVLEQRRFGHTNKEIGAALGIQPGRANEIYKHAIRYEERGFFKEKLWLRPTQSRPIDMGGPRGVWMTWTPETNWDEICGGGREA